MAAVSTGEMWRSLVNSALIGVDRQAFEWPVEDGALGEALARIRKTEAESSPAAMLLSAAAAAGSYRAAGRHSEAPPLTTGEAAPPEMLPLIPSYAEHFLPEVLGGDHAVLLAEFIELAAAKGRRIPEGYLPELLDAGRRRAELRPYLAAVGGGRAVWLAARNPEWSYLASAPAAEASRDASWEAGTKAERLAALAALRRSDPARARELLESTWKQEPAAERAALLAAFKDGLSIDDEAFLNQALADRSAEVARVAVDLLARLPESGYARRMAEQARRAVVFVERWNGWHAAFTVPEKLDEGLKADRVEEKSPYKSLGARAWILCQIVAGAPLSVWNDPELPAPVDVLSLAERSEWADAMTIGLGIALRRNPNAEWLDALIRTSLSRAEQNPALLEDLPQLEQFPGVAERLIADALEGGKSPLNDEHRALSLLKAYGASWSADLSRMVFRSIVAGVEQAQKTGKWPFQVSSAMAAFARRMDPSFAKEAAAMVDQSKVTEQSWLGAFDRMIKTLNFRREMRAAIEG